MIDIDKGVPIPIPEKKLVRSQYPIRYLEVGDSFAVEIPEVRHEEVRIRNSMQTLVRYYKKCHGIGCTIRLVKEDGQKRFRVWRIS